MVVEVAAVLVLAGRWSCVFCVVWLSDDWKCNVTAELCRVRGVSLTSFEDRRQQARDQFGLSRSLSSAQVGAVDLDGRVVLGGNPGGVGLESSCCGSIVTPG
ncbi:hypothetical protein BCR44DRAFT_1427712 [Catenaria anguillulae PL171]|uniref:Uncharacterized protein n=1 Tax=Catenaria anguillulae PL171 TaxID=765915 RepID=A0A1Y2HVW7_9FUNG|nr:hypothetical protein BCR44DRAFT_1427712 [Catenaria anguillulae PL171]